MQKFKNPFRDIKVEYTRSHPLTKVVVFVLIGLCLITMITLGLSERQMRDQIDNMRNEAAQLEAENAELQEKLEVVDSVEGVENIAQDELDLVDPDTIVIVPEP